MRLRMFPAALLTMATTLAGCSIGKTMKQEPEYLRNHHAGTVSFTSDKSTRAVFDALSEAARDCYATSASWVPASIIGGIFVMARAPGRTVEAKYEDTNRSAIIRIFVDGNLYLPIFQMDISEVNNRSKIDVYHANDNKLQRNIVTNAKAWIEGDLDFCERNWLEDRKRKKD